MGFSIKYVASGLKESCGLKKKRVLDIEEMENTKERRATTVGQTHTGIVALSSEPTHVCTRCGPSTGREREHILNQEAISDR